MRLRLKLLIIFLLFSFPVYAFQADIKCVCFPPGCEKLIIQEIDNAKTEIKVQAYSFTSAPIAKALLNAHKRNVDV